MLPLCTSDAFKLTKENSKRPKWTFVSPKAWPYGDAPANVPCPSSSLTVNTQKFHLQLHASLGRLAYNQILQTVKWKRIRGGEKKNKSKNKKQPCAIGRGSLFFTPRGQWPAVTCASLGSLGTWQVTRPLRSRLSICEF